MFLGILSSVFFLSGLCSLVYQIAWQRLLTVYYGVGMVSVTIIVSLYMLGLGLGALAGGAWAERSRDRVKLYFWVELFIGFFGLISLPFLDLLGRWTAGSHYAVTLLCQAAFLFVPTFLMGATLPLLTKIFNRIIGRFWETVSFLYFVNTLGAAFGALLAAYALITFWGLDGAVYFASAVNLALAAVVVASRRFLPVPGDNAKDASHIDGTPSSGGGRVVFLFVFLTGFLAIGYEIVWYRLIVTLLKPSAYMFPSMLSVYLLGLALGSFACGKLLRRRPAIDRRKLFVFLQFWLGVSVAVIVLMYYYLTRSTGFGHLTRLSFNQMIHPPVHFFLGEVPVADWQGCLKFFFVMGDIFFWPVFFCLFPTLIIGAMFPVVADLACFERDKEGLMVARVYFVNILGNVLGGVATGFLLLPFLGTERTLLVFVIVGLLVAGTLPLQRGPGAWRVAVALALAAFVIGIFPRAGQLYGVIHTPPTWPYVFYSEEGVDSVVMTYVAGEHVHNYINGRSQGGRPGHSFYAFVREALDHVPEAKNALVIGYGTGSITEGLLKDPAIRKITLVELSPTLVRNLRKVPLFDGMLADPRVELVIDDGRRFLLRDHSRYDLVFLTTSVSTAAYSNNIYSRQFFELVRDHLAEGGVVLTWMDEFFTIPNTLRTVFRSLKIYMSPEQDGFCLASQRPLAAPRRLRADAVFAAGFGEKDLQLIQSVRQRYRVITDPEIMAWLPAWPINEDWKPYNEYFIGRVLREWRWMRSDNKGRR